MKLGDKVLVRSPATDRMVRGICVKTTPDIWAFTTARMTVMARFERTSRYAPSCVLCGAEEVDDPQAEDRLWSFSVSEADRKDSPAHQTLLDAIGGEGWGRICGDCWGAIQQACTEAKLRTPKVWMSPLPHVRGR